MRVLGGARQQVQGILLRHSRIYLGEKGWTVAYRLWPATLRFRHLAHQILFQNYVDAVSVAEARVEQPTGPILDLLPAWSLAPVGEAIQAMRGVGFIVAVTKAAEPGDFRRFANPNQLTAYPRLSPSEYSCGATMHGGVFSKVGSGLARRALIEGAWRYGMQARVSRTFHDRLEALPATVHDIASKGQLRMCQCYRHLVAAGKAKVVTTAITREMAGFIWAISRAVPCHMTQERAPQLRKTP